jgi:hypothetical protein
MCSIGDILQAGQAQFRAAKNEVSRLHFLFELGYKDSNLEMLESESGKPTWQQ